MDELPITPTGTIAASEVSLQASNGEGHSRTCGSVCPGQKNATRSAAKSLRPYILLAALWLPIGAAQTSRGHPRFEQYPAGEIFTGTPVAPRIVTALEKACAHEIRDGVERGWGVFRDGKEQKGPNFAGHLIVIQWGCGAPCLRLAMVDARTGAVYYPPITANGVGARSFDLPLLTIGNAVSRNAKVQFRLDSNLMIIQATPSQAGRHPAYTYYFLWKQNRWALLGRAPLQAP
jgi:hypothetical protein